MFCLKNYHFCWKLSLILWIYIFLFFSPPTSAISSKIYFYFLLQGRKPLSEFVIHRIYCVSPFLKKWSNLTLMWAHQPKPPVFVWNLLLTLRCYIWEKSEFWSSDWQTHRKRCMWAHRAHAQMCSKNLFGAANFFKSSDPSCRNSA